VDASAAEYQQAKQNWLNRASRETSTAMTVSSRTPEGWPGRCPVCGAQVTLEPSTPFGDAPCPVCGQLLWFVDLDTGLRFFEKREAVEIIARNLGISEEEVDLSPSSSFLERFGADSLDIVELLLELEKEAEGS
jgi:acyl carrier protein